MEKTQSDRLKLNHLKDVCSENERFFTQFEIQCEGFFEKLKEIEDNAALKELCHKSNFPTLEALDERGDELIEAYQDACGQLSNYWITHCFGELISQCGYFYANMMRCNREPQVVQVFHDRVTSLRNFLIQEGRKDFKLTIRDLIQQIHDNCHALRHSLN